MFRRTPLEDWSNKETKQTASRWESDFKDILRSRKQSFKSVKDVSEALKDHVYSHAVEILKKEENFLSELESVNWAEVATTLVVNNPIWITNYSDPS
jgi:hypothetical protein